MDVVKIVAPKTLGHLLIKEHDPDYNRESVVVLAGAGSDRTVRQFAVAAPVYAAPTVTAGAVAGTGNGAVSNLSGDAGAPAGDYKILIVEPAANGGTFAVFRPNGSLDGAGVVGTPYNGSINFTLADGATDFAPGDNITVNVSYVEGAEKYVELDLAGTDGRQNVAGVFLFEAVAPNGVDGRATILKRGPAVIEASELVYPAGATDAQKTAIRNSLRNLGIVIRTGG